MSTLYDPYYSVTKMTKFNIDPRAKRRASGRAFAIIFIGWLVAIEIAQFVVAGGLHYDKALGPIAFPPGKLVFWVGAFYLRDYPSASFTRHVHEVFNRALLIAAAGMVLSVALGVVEYFRWRTNRSGLSTEKGDSRWANPEEIAAKTPERDPDDNLLPEGYDLHKGFSRQSRSSHRAVQQLAKGHFADKQRLIDSPDQEENSTP